ncbi:MULTISPECIES: hypothetical protein [unclassified Cryobacterium]|uniref:hypothetical protein n=1 Tax=unclassified Cryobacterium TaxID=2649013 RepID=UPI001F53E5C6|nr:MULTISPECIES: hypothetical protein [unclassified Cryobacterium]
MDAAVSSRHGPTPGFRSGMTEMMSMTAQMMDSSMAMKSMSGLDMAAMQDMIECCSACEQACTVCADDMMAMGMTGMSKCMSMCLDCADMTHTMMRMMLRPSGYDMQVMMAQMDACMKMCMACAAECMMHAEMSEECKMCAEACRQCAAACERMMSAMKSMMPMA